MARTAGRLRWKAALDRATDVRFAADGLDLDRRHARPAPESVRRRSVTDYDPRDISGRRAQSPYEATYDVATGYTLDRSIAVGGSG